MPLMLQVGFGLTTFASGSLTFAAAAGALTMKFSAARILKRFGFKTALLVNGVISTGFLAAQGLFTQETPHLAILAVLLAGGFFRSLQFTALNAISYSKTAHREMGKPTTPTGLPNNLRLPWGVPCAASEQKPPHFLPATGPLTGTDFPTHSS